MRLSAELPLDDDGYLRRQCPRCERVFKWHHSEATDEDAAPPEAYFCPYCGEPSPLDQWYTDEQVDYLQALVALGPTVDEINRSKGIVQIKLDVPQANPPEPLFEDDDMLAVEPPCHPEEPLKLLEDWDDLIHCLICGTAFRV
jgi:endogenous inhibitor of DNA gyrase (YacG/DUF329 family)